MVGRLQKKRIIITGAVDNIGLAAVESFVAEGANIVVGDIDIDKGRELETRFRDKVKFMKVDVTYEREVQKLVEKGCEWLGGLDVLCQNAGLQQSGAVVDFDQTAWDRLFAVNARAHFLGAKYAIPFLLEAKGGSIINVSSLAGQRGGPGMTAYSASKGASIAFTTALAMELAPQNIRANTICPGWVDTPFNAPAINFMGGRSVQEKVVSEIVPLGRQGIPNDIAPMFVYLASDESRYMTAQAITIDGGVYN